MNEPNGGMQFNKRRMTQAQVRARLKVDELCSSFETGWNRDSIADIVEISRGVDSSYQSNLFNELLSIDFEMRQALDEELDLDEYVEGLPEFSHETAESIQAWLKTAKLEPSVAQMESRKLTQIGDYRIVKLIGRGGTGEVYEAVQESLDRTVAIKTLRHPHVTSQMARFQQEARYVAMLHHTNIVAVYGSGADDGIPYIAMQLVDGQGLDRLIEQAVQEVPGSSDLTDGFLSGPERQRNVCRIGMEVARALGHAHQHGLLHRDIKPSNLLVDQNRTTWVTDFGLAKLRDESSNNTLAGSVVGTMRYVPPEAFSGDWTEQGDIYSLGATLYELLVLKPAYSAMDHPELIKQITQGDGPEKLPRQLDSTISKDLEIIVSKAMSFEPAMRFSSANEMADELERVLNGEPIKSRPIPAIERFWRWAKRKPTAAALALLTCAVAFIGLPIAIGLWLTASSALEVAEQQRELAVERQFDADHSRRDAEAARYSSGLMLADAFIDDGRTGDAKRILSEVKATRVQRREERICSSDQWELDYLQHRLDGSKITLRGEQGLGVWDVAIRPDQKQIATVHGGYPATSFQQGEVVLWNAVTGEKEFVLRGHGSRVYGCDYSNDGKQLATIGFDNVSASDAAREYSRGSITLWDVRTGEKIRSINLSGEYVEAHMSGIGAPVLPDVEFSHDDKRLVSWPEPVEVRDAETLDLHWSHDGVRATVDPQGNVLAFSRVKSRLSKHNMQTGKQVSKLNSQWVQLAFFCYSSDGRKLLCKGIDRVRFWGSAESLGQYQDISVPGVYWATISPDGSNYVTSTGSGEVRIRSINRSAPRSERILLGHDSTVTCGAYSEDGSWLVTASVDGTAKIWDLSDEGTMLETTLRHEQVCALSFANSGDEIVYCARRNNIDTKFNAGKRDLTGNNHSDIAIETTYCATWPRGDFSFSQDGSLLAAPAIEKPEPKEIRGLPLGGKVGVWSTDDWRMLHLIETEFSNVLLTAWTSNNQILAVAGTAEGIQEIRFYRVNETTVEPIGRLYPSARRVTSMVFHESQKLAVGTQGEILTWELSFSESGSEPITFSELNRFEFVGHSASLDFSPNGSRLASANFADELLQVFDCDMGSLCYERAGPRRCCCVCYSPCGKRIALSGYDSIVHLCDAEFGYRLLTLNGCKTSPGTYGINSKVVFSPDGRRISTNNWLGQIAFWEIQEKED